MSLLHELEKLPKPYVFCVVTSTEGSVPGKTGFKMAVFPDGKIRGTVGGGDIERQAVLAAQDMIRKRESHRNEKFALSPEHAKDADVSKKTAMICGGTASIYFELFPADLRAVLFGGGHVGQALAPLLVTLGYHVEIYDNRSDFVTADKFPPGVKVSTGDYQEFAGQICLDDMTFCLIFTHGHAHDYQVLKGLLERPELPRYVGMIGSRTKVRETLKRIEQEGVPSSKTQSVFTPVGLNIGGETPHEIALSIAAELQAVRYERPCTHMKVHP